MEEISKNDIREEITNALPVIVSRGFILYPNNSDVLYLERPISINAFNESINSYNSYCVLIAQKDSKKSDFLGKLEEVYEYGTICQIKEENSNSSKLEISLDGLKRVKINSFYMINGSYFCNFTELSTTNININRTNAIFDNLLSLFNEKINPIVQKQIVKVNPNDNDDLENFCYFAGKKLFISPKDLTQLLSFDDIADRLEYIYTTVYNNIEAKKVDRELDEKIHKAAIKNQREYILREKMKAIQSELGNDGENFFKKIDEKLKSNNYPVDLVEKINNELNRLNTMPQGSLEASLIQDYIELMMSIPWIEKTQDNDNIENAINVLNEDHYGLKKVKERIIEYLAVKKNNGNLKAPILCFYGPPGCGKTSLSKSIARALNRKFIKCSLGGISDEAEIRGHRRTYVGSKPGRIISSLIKVKARNPVFLLDEVDKLGRDSFKGDPSSALLEVLDPEQNFQFNDNYVEVPYDLSDVLFICTANDLSTIPEPLMDRLELIEVESYTLIDKLHIAKDFLIKIELKNNGLTTDDAEFDDEAICYIIERYTHEAGVRSLQRNISSLLRKIVVDKMKDNIKEKVIIDTSKVRQYLGIETYDLTSKEKGNQVGVVTGLAWTPYGGDILPIEVNYFPGKGNLALTGKLGDVMKESCAIALDYIKANATKYNIDPILFEKNDIHVHVPEGAVSKDGPSAGCAITTAMVSAFTKKPVSGDIAMTGEVTLRGNALAIGGLREKSLAALRSGIKTIIVPDENKKTVSELPKEITDNIEIKYIKNVQEAISICLGI